jgi:lipoate-protein ligase A
LLQQGSLPLDDRAAEFFGILRFPDAETRAKALQLYNQKTTPLHTFNPQASWDDVAQAFRHGFSAFLEHEFVTEELTDAEWTLAHQLVKEKYHTLEWRKARVSLV